MSPYNSLQFHGRLYLDGTVSSDGRITGDNSINIRLIKGQGILVNGSVFGDDATSVSVKFVYGDGSEVAGTVTSCGENLVAVAWPDGLSGVAAGTEVQLTVTRTEGEATYVSTPKSATIVTG